MGREHLWLGFHPPVADRGPGDCVFDSVDRPVGPNDVRYAGYTLDYNLYSSVDGSTWNFLSSGTLIDTYDSVHTIDTGGALMRSIKYEVVGGNHWANLFEFEAYANPGVPEPSTFFLLAGGPAIGFARLRNVRPGGMVRE